MQAPSIYNQLLLCHICYEVLKLISNNVKLMQSLLYALTKNIRHIRRSHKTYMSIDPPYPVIVVPSIRRLVNIVTSKMCECHLTNT